MLRVTCSSCRVGSVTRSPAGEKEVARAEKGEERGRPESSRARHKARDRVETT